MHEGSRSWPFHSHFPCWLNRGRIANASAWLPLLYDTIVFVLTLNRVMPRTERLTATVLRKRLFEDGIIYYRYSAPLALTCKLSLSSSAIFGVTLVLAIMIPSAPPGLKNITAQ